MSSEAILELIRELAAMPEPGARVVWQLVHRQVMLEGIIGTIAGTLFMAGGLGLIAWAIFGDFRGYDEPIGQWLGGIFCVITGIVLLACYPIMLLNPDYYAVMRLAGMVK